MHRLAGPTPAIVRSTGTPLTICVKAKKNPDECHTLRNIDRPDKNSEKVENQKVKIFRVPARGAWRDGDEPLC